MPLGIKRPTELTKKLRTRKRTGFFDVWETPQRRQEREKLARQSVARQRIRGIFESVSPAIQAARQRGVFERQRQTQEDTSSGLGGRFFEQIQERRAARAEREKREQELEIAEATRRFRSTEQQLQPVSPERARNLLDERKARGERMTRLFERQASRYATPPPSESDSPLIQTLDSIAGLGPEQRAEVLAEIERRGDENVTVFDAYRFAGNVIAGRSPGYEKGVYAIPGQRNVDIVSDPANIEPTAFVRTPEGRQVPLRLPLTTARGRLLAEWQAQWRRHSGLSNTEADRRAALAFNEQIEEFRETSREELESRAQEEFGEELGEKIVTESEIDKRVDIVFDIELRRTELLDQALREYAHQRGIPGLVPRAKEAEEINRQVAEAMQEEFADEFEYLHPTSHGLERMMSGLWETGSALVRLSPSIQAMRTTGLPMSSSVDTNEALPDLLKGLDDYFGGGYEISRPVLEAAVPKPLEAPLSAGLEFAITKPIRGTEEVASLFPGVEVRGELSGSLSEKMTDEFFEDFMAELLNPAALIIALPFLGYGLRAGMGIRAATTQMTANLLGTGLEPRLARGTARGISLLAREGPRALPRIPQNIRNTRAFQLAQRNLKSEVGGLRISRDGVNLSAEAERVMSLAELSKPLRRGEILRAAKQEGIHMYQRMSNEDLLLALRGKKRGFERLLAINKSLRESRPIGVRMRRRIDNLLELGNKAKLKDLQAAASGAGIRGAQRLSKTNLLRELSRVPETGIEAMARQPHAVMDVAPRVAGTVPGPLADVPDDAVRRVFKDILQGNESTEALRPIRGVVERELQRVGRSAEEVWLAGDAPLLGREARAGGDVPAAAIPRRFEGGIREFEEATRQLRFSDDPAQRMRGIADEAAGFGGRGGGGIARPPTSPLHPRLPDGPIPGRKLPKLDTLEKIARDFEYSIDNMAAGLARIVGKAPPARAMLKFFNPTPFFEGKIGYALGGFLRKYQAESHLAASMTSSMRAEEKALFRFTDNIADWHKGAILRSRQGRAVTPEYLVQFPDDIIRVDRNGRMIGRLADEQRKFIDETRSLLDQELVYEKGLGVQVDEIAEGIEEGRYFHREVLNAPSLADKEALITRRGASIDYVRGFMKDRQFATMYEGMQTGVKYGDGISENVMARVRAGKMAALDKEVITMLADEGEQAMIKSMIANHQGGAEFGAIKALEMFNNVARPMMTNLDLGFIGLQMFPVMMRNPIAGARGIMMAFDGFFTDGRYMAKYVRKVLDDGTLVDALNNGLLWNQAEFTFEYAAKGGLGFFNRGPFARGNAAFANSLNIATLETYKGMVGVNDWLYRALGNRRASALITQAFGGFAPIEGRTARQQAASVANKLTLRMDSAAIGIARGQRGFEGAMLFAPRYYRAFFGLLGDAMQGGMRGAESRRSLSQMFAGFFAISMGLQYATGQELEMNPLNRNFWQSRVGDVHVGPGGPFVSLMSLIGKAKDRPERLLSGDINENPLLRWGRGKLAPGVSTIVDFIDGQNFMFEERDITNPMDWVYMMSERFEPFFVQAGWETWTKTKDLQSTGIAVGGEILAGTRTWPETRREHRDDIRNEVSQRLHGEDYEDLNQLEQSEVREDSDVAEAQKELDEYWDSRGSEVAQARKKEDEYLQQWTETGRVVTDTGTTFMQDSTQTEDNTMFDSGDIDGQAWISRYRDRQDAFYSFRDGLRVGLGTQSDFEEEPTNEVDAAIKDYYDILPRNYLDEDNEVKWDNYWEEKDAAFAKAVQLGGPEMKDYLRPPEKDPMVAAFKEVGVLRRRLKDVMPKYRFVTKEQEVQVDELLLAVKAATGTARERGIKNIPSQRRVLAAVLGQMDSSHPLYTIVAVALLRKTDETRELVWNPERDELVMKNPMMVKFYISMFKNMTEMNKLRFIERYGLKYFSHDFIAEEELLNP